MVSSASLAWHPLLTLLFQSHARRCVSHLLSTVRVPPCESRFALRLWILAGSGDGAAALSHFQQKCGAAALSRWLPALAGGLGDPIHKAVQSNHQE
jgi:hypothetical protein